MSRMYLSRFVCGHAGCTKIANYESATRKEQGDILRRYSQGQWRCVRHTSPNEVLSKDSPRIVYEITSDERAHGKYFGNFGFTHGPGFKVFADDFPPGTTLRVIAEVILPTEPQAMTPPAAPEGDRWMPIETAPRDGARIWAYFPFRKDGFAARWERNVYEDDINWTLDGGESAVLLHDLPSHWMPLPGPP